MDSVMAPKQELYLPPHSETQYEIVSHAIVQLIWRKRRNLVKMTTTERAARKLKDDLVRKFLDEGIGLRVVGNGHDVNHGDLILKIDRVVPTDTVVESHGIRILLDSVSAAALDRYELDYNDRPGGFFFKPRD